MEENKKTQKDLFWADQLAIEAIARAKKENVQVTCRGGASTSGAKHIGNLFDVMKAYIVYKAVCRKKYPARFVFTHDDRDPLRTVPNRLPGLDGKWMEIKGEMEKAIIEYLGVPYFKIPDPFDCCDSWAEHFARVWENGVKAMGVKVEFHSMNKLYNESKLEPYIILALTRIEKTREVIKKFQETKTDDYIPFDVICDKCGKIIGRAVSFDLNNKTIDYVCEGKSLAGKYVIEGCGHKGTTNFNGGKLPWSFEWPAAWDLFKTTFEPFGKEHAEGSWPRGQAIAKHVFGFEPPIPHIYEFLLINGEKMSARRGNVYIVQEMLDIVEPEIFSYFYTKRSKEQRNLDVKNIHLLVEEFEHAEKVYFGINDEKNERDKLNLIRMYESSVNEIPKNIPMRIPYQFAAIIASVCPYDSADRAIELLKASGHVKDRLSKEDMFNIERRLALAKNWIENFSPEMKIKINDVVPEITKQRFTDEQRNAIRHIASELKKDMTEKELYEKLYETSKACRLNTKDFFRAAYLVLIGKESGPRLASFIIAIGRDRVRKIFEQV